MPKTRRVGIAHRNTHRTVASYRNKKAPTVDRPIPTRILARVLSHRKTQKNTPNLLKEHWGHGANAH